ncbi:MAG: YggT family protein [Sphingomicrobium sp.]
MLHALIQIAHYLLSIIQLIIIVQVIVSWLFAFNVLNASSQGVRTFAIALDRVTAPIYRPIRALLPDFGGLDFSPFVAWIIIQVLQMLLSGADSSLTYNGG